MRLVFFGTAEFAVPSLEALAEHVVLVVSQPDRPSGRGLGLKPSPVTSAAERLGLTVETPVKCRAPEFVERVAALAPDALVVAAYGQILSEALLGTAKRGGINVHGSALPKYRGAAPIQRAVLAGDAFTGVCLMQMDKGLDTGDVIACELTAVGPEETAGELTARLAGIGARLAAAWMPLIAAGQYERTPQDHSQATHAPKLTKEEGELSFSRPAAEEAARFRAFTPNPGASLKTSRGTLRLWRASLEPVQPQGDVPGAVLAVRPNLVVAFEGGALCLAEVQPEGKKRMSGADWANGARIRPGDDLRP